MVELPTYTRRWATLAALVLLAGFSGSLRALPENTQSGYVDPNITLNFPARTPITLSGMMIAGRSEVGNAHKGLLEYDLDSGLTSTGSVATRKAGNPTDTSMTWERLKASQVLDGESGAVALGATSVMPSSVTWSESAEMANDLDLLPTISEYNEPEGQESLREEAAVSPYATITLAAFALLGVVSVARRNDIG